MADFITGLFIAGLTIWGFKIHAKWFGGKYR